MAAAREPLISSHAVVGASTVVVEVNEAWGTRGTVAEPGPIAGFTGRHAGHTDVTPRFRHTVSAVRAVVHTCAIVVLLVWTEDGLVAPILVVAERLAGAVAVAGQADWAGDAVC